MGALRPRPRPRVYVQFRHRNALMRRVLDIAFVRGTEPVAVITWTRIEGEMHPGDYIELDERRLRRAVPAGMYWYDRVIDDPRFPPPLQAVASAHAGGKGEGEKQA
ncbi:MAG TPA: hypothetical protein VG873_00330 [Burkholderiales bacterium]|nr:hypothetical protein [Burkholderiales bacterium]